MAQERVLGISLEERPVLQDIPTRRVQRRQGAKDDPDHEMEVVLHAVRSPIEENAVRQD